MPDKDNPALEPTKVDNSKGAQNKAHNLDAASLKKFEGKTKDEIVEMFINLEKFSGKLAKDLGDLRKEKDEQTDPFNLFSDEPIAVTEKDNLKEDTTMTKTEEQIAQEEAAAKAAEVKKAEQASTDFAARLALARTDSSMPKFQEIENDVLAMVAGDTLLQGKEGLKRAYNLVMSEKIVKADAEKVLKEAEEKRKQAELLAQQAIAGGQNAPSNVVTQKNDAKPELSAKEKAKLAWLSSSQDEEALTNLMMGTLVPVEEAKLLKK